MVVIAGGWRIVIAGVGRRVRIRIRISIGVRVRIGVRDISRVWIRIGDRHFFVAGRKGQQEGREND
jgi:hypothetical protein